MFSVFCLASVLTASASDDSVRAWSAAEDHIARGNLTEAFIALEEASEGVAAPIAIFQEAILRQAALDGSESANEAFIASVNELADIEYGEMRILATYQPAAQPVFYRSVINREIAENTMAALTLQAAALEDSRGNADAAAAFRERIIQVWPETVDARYLTMSTQHAAH